MEREREREREWFVVCERSHPGASFMYNASLPSYYI
jgi:hypothetical protein